MARPRKSTEADVIAAATNVFWTRGFDATSMRALGVATGLDQKSLAQRYGSKHGLFHLCLESYAKRLEVVYARLFDQPGIAAIVAAFDLVASPGCLLVTVRLEAIADDATVDAAIRRHRQMQLELFISALEFDGVKFADRRAVVVRSVLDAALLEARSDSGSLSRLRQSICEELDTWLQSAP